MKYITVNTTLDATNVKAYAVCVEETATDEEVQKLVHDNRDQPAAKYSVIEMSNIGNAYRCDILQRYGNVDSNIPVNITDGNHTVYVVTIGKNKSEALNGTMKTTTTVLPIA